MTNDIASKLSRLEALSNLALFRWTATTKRVGGKFIPLSEIRLNILSCNKGAVHFSMSAPVLYMAHGRPRVGFHDADVFRVVDGPRKNINLLHTLLKENEQAVEIKNCLHTVCSEDSCDMVKNKVLGMGNSPAYPVVGLAMPDMYRLTSDPKTLRPIYSKTMLSLIGGTPEDTADSLRMKFADRIDLFGYKTDDGYVVNNEWIAAGGMICVTSEGISRNTGSPVYQIPLEILKLHISSNYWNIHLEDEHEMEGQAECAVP